MLKPKISFMTSLGVNVGDEFIREGICSFFDEIFDDWTPLYVNKVDLKTLYQPVLDESIEVRDKFFDADIIIQAGAPVYWNLGKHTSYNVEWAEELWLNRIFKLGPEKPILNIAAGACQPYPDYSKTFLEDPRCVEFAKAVAAACRWTSVRDPLASQILYALNIEHEVLPCTAFHAARRVNIHREPSNLVGINLMKLGGHYKLKMDIDEHAWEKTIQSFLPEIRKHHRIIFIAHDILEQDYMQQFRVGDEKIFLSPDYKDYLHVYAGCDAVVANRVHGAVCAAGFGIPSIIIGNDTRLLIADYIGIPSFYVNEISAEAIISSVEAGIADQKKEKDRLLTVREESAERYRNAIQKSIENLSLLPKIHHQLQTEKSLKLGSVSELSSVKFKDFMTTMNCFAARLGLRQLANWSKIWEYPWLWFNSLSKMNWAGMRLLDIGSEISPMPWFLASLGAQVTLVEADSQWKTVWEKVRQKTNLNVDWHIISDENLPLETERFDVVTSFSVIEHQPDKKRAVREILRILKPGGLFALSFDICEPDIGMTFPEWNGRALTMQEFEELIWNNSGFEKQHSPEWNIKDIPSFIQWHLKSAPYHNYTVGAAFLKKQLNNSSLLKEQPKKILLPRFDTIGDIILLEGFLEALLNKFPEAEISIVVREQYMQLQPLFPKNIRWLSTTVNPYGESDPKSFKSLLDRLSGEEWDLILTTTHNRTYIDESIGLKLYTIRNISLGKNGLNSVARKKAIKYLGYQPQSGHFEYIPVEEFSHETEKYATFWQLLTGQQEIPKPSLYIPDSFLESAEQIIADLGLNENYCVCLPAGVMNNPLKVWPENRFADIIVWLSESLKLQTLLVGHETERPLIEKVARLAKNRGCTSFIWIGKDGDIPILSALIKKAKLYFGNDTGPMHIAAVLNIPTVGIFGGGYWPRFLPLGRRAVGVAGILPCFGCDWDCIFNDVPCMRLVSTEDAKKAIMHVLESESIDSNILQAAEPVSHETEQFIEKAVVKHKKTKARLEKCEIIPEDQVSTFQDQRENVERLSKRVNTLEKIIQQSCKKLYREKKDLRDFAKAFETSAIDFGTNEATIFLLSGWSCNETLPEEGVTFNWAVGRCASLFLSLPKKKVTLTVRVRAPHFQEPQTVAIRVDGNKIGGWKLASNWEWEEHSIIISSVQHRAGVSLINFRFSQNLKTAEDPRQLAVMFASLTLTMESTPQSKQDAQSDPLQASPLSHSLLQRENPAQNEWPQEVMSLVKKAEELIKKGNLSDLAYACDAIDEALDMAPDDPILIVTRGKIMMLMGDREAAHREFDRAARVAPVFVPILLKQMNIEYSSGQKDRTVDPQTEQDYTEPPSISAEEIIDYAFIKDRVNLIEGLFIPEQEEFFFNKIRSLPDDAVIVETGSYKGRSTVIMGYACKGTNRRVYSIHPKNSPSFDKWKDAVQKNDLDQYVKPITGVSDEVLEKWHENTGLNTIDFIFFGGSQNYLDVLKDFEAAFPLLKKGGWIAFERDVGKWPGSEFVWKEVAQPMLENHECLPNLALGQKPVEKAKEVLSEETWATHIDTGYTKHSKSQEYNISSQKIHIIGDSHAFSFQNIENCVIHHLGPVTMHRIGRDGINIKDYDVNENDYVVFFFGEIDVRCHIGIQRDKKNRELDEIIETLADKYITAILGNKNQFRNTHLLVCSVVPPSDAAFNPTFPFYGTLEERIEIAKQLNTALKNKCELTNIGFINIYNYYSYRNGAMNPAMSDDGVHISFKHNDIIQKCLFDYINNLKLIKPHD